jgi:hypothetical protein
VKLGWPNPSFVLAPHVKLRGTHEIGCYEFFVYPHCFWISMKNEALADKRAEIQTLSDTIHALGFTSLAQREGLSDPIKCSISPCCLHRRELKEELFEFFIFRARGNPKR